MRHAISAAIATLLLFAGSVDLAQAGDPAAKSRPVRLSDSQMDSVAAGGWWRCGCTGTTSIAIASAQSVAKGTTTYAGAFTTAIVSPGTAYASSISIGTVGF